MYIKWIVISLVLLIVLCVACVFWYRHETAPYKQEVVEAEEFVRQWKRNQETKTDSQQKQPEISKTTKAQEPEIANETTDGTTDAETERIPSISFKNPAPVRYSPHGLGPYPEVSKEYFLQKGPISWQLIDLFGKPPPSLETELIDRVLLKLWKDGDTTWKSGTFRNGKVYVLYPNRALIRYSKVKNLNGKVQKNPDGTPQRYISMWMTAGGIPKPTQEQFLSGELPKGVEIIDLDADEDIGIEPYSFLGLEK